MKKHLQCHFGHSPNDGWIVSSRDLFPDKDIKCPSREAAVALYEALHLAFKQGRNAVRAELAEILKQE